LPSIGDAATVVGAIETGCRMVGAGDSMSATSEYVESSNVSNNATP
jgi:hypothetical protein